MHTMISLPGKFVITLVIGLTVAASALSRNHAGPTSLWSGGRLPAHRHFRQAPRDVTIRPRVRASDPKTPSITVTVNRNAVPLGELVVFSFSPAKVVLDPQYSVTIFFGDGKRLRITQPQVNHLYTRTGVFTYSLSVKLAEPKPPVPGVKLIVPAQALTGRQVNFRAELSQAYPSIKFRFVFDDGSQTDWQPTGQTTHRYRSSGSYRVYVDLGLGDGQATKQVGGSLRQSIEVKDPPSPPIAVDLTTSKVALKPMDEVTFLAHLRPGESNVSYRFVFGDRSVPTGWQTSPQAKHVYLRPGNFSARVEVRTSPSRTTARLAQSRPLLLTVQPPSPPSLPKVDLMVMPATVPLGLPIDFFATSDPFNSKIRYRFHFGDGSQPSAWKGAQQEVRVYPSSGDFQAFVEIGFAGSGPIKPIASSGKRPVHVMAFVPDPRSSPTPLIATTPNETPVSTPSVSASPKASASPLISPGPTSVNTSSPTPKPSASDLPIIGGLTPTPSPDQPLKQDEGDGKESWGNWWKYLLAAIILIAGYRVAKYFFVPPATLVPNVDRGDSQLGTEGGPLAFNFQLELDPSVTDGEFKIDTSEGSLIKSERKTDG